MSSKKNEQTSAQVDDIFNETDEDKEYKVVEVHSDRDPPVVLCISVKIDNESSETEEEYVLEYVE